MAEVDMLTFMAIPDALLGLQQRHAQKLGLPMGELRPVGAIVFDQGALQSLGHAPVVATPQSGKEGGRKKPHRLVDILKGRTLGLGQPLPKRVAAFAQFANDQVFLGNRPGSFFFQVMLQDQVCLSIFVVGGRARCSTLGLGLETRFHFHRGNPQGGLIASQPVQIWAPLDGKFGKPLTAFVRIGYLGNLGNFLHMKSIVF